VRVEDYRAVRVLEIAFAAMLRKGGEPVVIEITRDAASAFPRHLAALNDSVGAKHWLAVGLDHEGRGTYSLRHMKIVAVAGSKEALLAEHVMLNELQRETGRQGFPIGPTRGGVC
jgi:hypothetical protein